MIDQFRPNCFSIHHRKVTGTAGFSTLEILIAAAIFVLTIAAVLGLVYSNQRLAIDAETAGSAARKAQGLLETARASAALDFNLVNPIAAAADADPMYQKSLDVQMADFWTKQVTANVVWNRAAGGNASLSLTTLLTNPLAALNGGSTCSSVLSGDWKNPRMFPPSGYDFGTELLVPPATSTGFSITDVEADNKKLFVATEAVPSGYRPANMFYVFDISAPPQKPQFLGAADSLSPGLSAIAVAGNYAYVASQTRTGQLQVIDIGNLTSPSVAATVKVAAVSGSGAQGFGSAIFYADKKVFLGLTTAGSGPEFAVFDVSVPTAPVYLGGYDLNHDVNAIYVKGNYAYLAHATDAVPEQLTVLDVSNPAAIVRVSGFYFTPSSGGNGKSLALIGRSLYLGRTASKISGSAADNIPEFFALDASVPTSIPASALGFVPLATPESLNALAVRDYLAFFLTSSQFQIWNIASTSAITSWNSLSLPSGKGRAMDCEDNYFYIAEDSSQGNHKDLIGVIGPGP